MKTKSTLLLALALGLASLSTASAGLITDPLGFQAPFIDQGLTTDPLGQGGPNHLPLPPANVPAAAQFLASAIADGKTVRLSDLMRHPDFFAAAHAAGPEADALRGQIDWLIMSGVILGLDGDDGLDDLTGDAGDDVLNWSWGASNPAIILGGPGGDTLAPFNPSIILGGPGGDTLQAPINGFVFGTTSYLQPAPLNWSWGETNFFTDILVSGAVPSPVNGIILGGPGSDNIILGGPGSDTLAIFNPSIILGGPGSDNVILGGPGSDNIEAPINGFVNGTPMYLK